MTNTQMILLIGLICAVMTGFRLLWIAFQTVPAHPLAAHGVLDLRSMSADVTAPIPLEGEWEFYPQQWLMPGEGGGPAPAANPTYLRVPGKWDSAISSGAGARGYGTYRLLVRTRDNRDTLYGIRVLEEASASDIYVNGHLIGGNGRPAESQALHKAGNAPYSVYFTANENTIEILMHVSNYEFARGGGLVDSVKFGTAEAIQRQSLFYISTNMIAAIVMFLYGFCAFILYLLRNRVRVLLYFSLLLFSGAGTIMTNYEKLLLAAVPSLSFEWSMKLQYLSYCGTALSVILFLKHLFPEYGKAGYISRSIAVCGAITLLCLFVPGSYVIAVRPLFVLLTAASAIIVPVFYIREAWKRNEGSFYMLLGACGTLSHTIWSVVANVGLNETAYYPFDLIVSFFSLALFWSVKFFRATADTKQLAEALQQTDRNKDEFLAVTSHELRNPLHGMINIARTVIDTAKHLLDDKHIKDLELLISVGRRMSFLLNDLMDLDRLKANAVRLEIASTRVQPVASVVLDMLQFMTEGKIIRLVNEIPAGFPAVKADENRLQQILFNLIHNAVKYTHEGSISVSAELRGGMAHIHVHDTGSGMDEQMQRKIFQPYERGDANFTDSEGGLGLGLSICTRLIEMHGGTLTVRSQPGLGSVFTFTLPLAEAADQPVASDDEELLAAHSGRETAVAAAAAVSVPAKEPFFLPIGHMFGKSRILVVDDDAVNLKILHNLLSAESYDVVTATSGREALTLLHAGYWDLVISDVTMPRMSGYELTRAVRERFSISELPVLLLTARNRPEDVSMGFLSGANDYVTKPLDALELKFRVSTLTNLNRSFRERLNLEAAWLQAQIKPHFLFNALNSIAALSEFDMARMRDLLEAFTRYLRASFDFHNQDQLIPLEHELEHVRSYLSIEKERFEDRLEIVWELNGGQHLLVPPLSVQPLVENAVRHGIMGHAKGGTLWIRVIEQADGTEIAVSDNGVGMTEERLQEVLNRTTDERQGVGLYNLDRRLKQLFGQSLNVRSEPGHGTTVTMFIPDQSGRGRD